MLDFLKDLDPTTATLYIGALVPLVVGAITKKYANPGLKAVANVLVAAILGSLTYLVTADGYDFGGFINHGAEAFLSGIASYYGFFKPTGLAGKIANKTGNFGLGKPDLTAPDKGAEDAGDPTADVVAEEPPVTEEQTPQLGDGTYEIDLTSTHPDEDPLDHVGEIADAPEEIGRMP